MIAAFSKARYNLFRWFLSAREEEQKKIKGKKENIQNNDYRLDKWEENNPPESMTKWDNKNMKSHKNPKVSKL